MAAFKRLLGCQGWTRGLRALDLGTGAGTYVRLLAAEGHHVIGVDYSIVSLRSSLLADSARVGQYVGAEAYSLPFPAAAFDLVVVIGVFQVLSEPERALCEIHRILRPGGHLVLEILNADEVLRRLHRMFEHVRRQSSQLRFYRRSQMNSSLRATGFRPLRAEPIFLPPRSLPHFEQVLEHPVPRALLSAVPGFPRLSAAAFLILSRKEAASPESATQR